MLAAVIFLLFAACSSRGAWAFISGPQNVGGHLISPSLRQAACTSSPVRLKCFGGHALRMSAESEVDNELKIASIKQIKLGEIFNKERKYLLDVKYNVRDYAWKNQPVEELTDGIFQEIEDGKADAFSASPYLLGLVTCSRRKQELKDEMRVGEIWELLDGQQRLITISLLYAAIRDRLRALITHDMPFDTPESDAESIEELANDIQNRLFHKKTAKKPAVARIEMQSFSKYPHREIMNGSLTLFNITTVATKNLQEDQALITEHFEYLGDQLHGWGFDQLQQLSDYMEHNIYIDFKDDSFERAIQAISQQGKGQDVETIDWVSG
jgi:hypothetical protein